MLKDATTIAREIESFIRINRPKHSRIVAYVSDKKALARSRTNAGNRRYTVREELAYRAACDAAVAAALASNTIWTLRYNGELHSFEPGIFKDARDIPTGDMNDCEGTHCYRDGTPLTPFESL